MNFNLHWSKLIILLELLANTSYYVGIMLSSTYITKYYYVNQWEPMVNNNTS